MKYLLSLIVTISILCTSLSAVEYKTYSIGVSQISEIITLDAGDVLEVIGDGEFTAKLGFISYESNIKQEDLHAALGNHYPLGRADAQVGYKFAGPIKLTIYGTGLNGSDKAIVSVKITRASELEYKQANIVSLPADTVGQGTHEIVVEASDDLQTWTPVHSSSIGGNKTFFRTRVLSLALGAEPAD